MSLRRFLQIYAVAGLIVLAILWAIYSQRLLKQLEQETLFRSRLYASYIEAVGSPDSEASLENLLFEEVVSRIDFPVVITDPEGNPQSFRNVPPRDTASEELLEFIKELDRSRAPIPIRAVIQIDSVTVDTVTLTILHYGLPRTWAMLQYFPLVQASFIALFVILGFVYIFATARRAQERLWVALAREAAHQLGTPISSLMGWSELIRPKLDKEASAEIKADLDRTKSILDRFARIGDKPRLEPHPVKKIIKQTVDFMRKRAPARIEFSVNVKDNAQILIDPTLISWTLENLVRNSIDAIGRRSGKIELQGQIVPRQRGFFRFSSRDKMEYEITVTDNGPGILAKQSHEIFKTGFTTKKHGWGIGLALSRRVIEKFHRGKLKVKSSKPGKTVLSVTLPLWQE